MHAEADKLLSMGVREYVKEYHPDVLPKSYTETITLDKSAKIINHSEIFRLKETVLNELDDKQWDEKQGAKNREEAIAIEKKYRQKYEAIEDLDDGSFAALLGYDAINAEGHGESGSYTVILNRTKVIIRRP